MTCTAKCAQGRLSVVGKMFVIGGYASKWTRSSDAYTVSIYSGASVDWSRSYRGWGESVDMFGRGKGSMRGYITSFGWEDANVGMKGKARSLGVYKDSEASGPPMAVPGLCSATFPDSRGQPVWYHAIGGAYC